jgi:drug/metabolite transporter (DMT)-like permease
MSVAAPVVAGPPAPAVARGYLLIHVCVVLWGFTPIMGRLITLDAVALVWWRMLLAALALLLVPSTWRGLRQLSPRLIAGCCGVGLVLAVSWALFYLSIKLTNASVGAVCLGTAPLFIAVLGPLFTRRRYRRVELALALAIIPGVALVAGGIPRGMYVGFGVGLLSAGLLAGFSGLNKLLAGRAHALAATAIELAAGALFLTLVIAVLPRADAGFLLPRGRDVVLLLVFAIALTSLPLALMLVALRSISAFAQQMATNLEPVYAVLLAIPILGEQRELAPLFYAGVVVILGAVLLEPAVQRWRARQRRGPAGAR